MDSLIPLLQKTIGTIFGRLIIIWTWCLQQKSFPPLTCRFSKAPRNWVVDCPQHLPSAPHVGFGTDEKTSTNQWGIPGDLFFGPGWRVTSPIFWCQPYRIGVWTSGPHWDVFISNCCILKVSTLETLSWLSYKSIFVDGHWWANHPATNKKWRIGGETLHTRSMRWSMRRRAGDTGSINCLPGALKHAIFIVFNLNIVWVVPPPNNSL